MVALHLIQRGSGPSILFVHGLGKSSETWQRCMTALEDEFTVGAIDLLGHGQSPAPADPKWYTRDHAMVDLDHSLRTLGNRPILVGHSLGGYLSLAYVATRLEVVQGLVLINTGPGYRDPAKREEWNKRSNRRAEGFGVLPHVTTLNLQHDSLVIDGLPGIAVPTLVLVGGADRPEYTMSGRYMENKIPNAQMVILEDGAHSMHESTHADEIARLISAFAVNCQIQQPGRTSCFTD